MKRKKRRCRRCGGGFVTEYRHHRTKKVMVAKDYGYRSWPFGCRCRRK